MEIVNAPHQPVREQWLALHREDALLPQLKVVDAHHHLWDRQSGRYLAHEFSQDIQTSGHRIVSSVYVQCRSMLRQDGPDALKPVGEVEFASGVAAMFASGHYGDARGCEAIIGGASLLAGDGLQQVIDVMMQHSGGRLRGMRNPLAWHQDPRVASSPASPPAGLSADADFRRGAACLARNGLPLDVWVYHTQLEEIACLARALPELQIIVDHCGGPIGVGPYAGRRDEVFQQWRGSMMQLAALPNISIKISGFGMTVMGYPFAEAPMPPDSATLAQQWRPWFETILALFGAERCMFASNFPVDKGMFSYGAFWNACKRLAQQASDAERAQLFWRTAATRYRLASLEKINEQQNAAE
ncbi:amidohydrolase [Izhakiella australiensis]|uniref:Amidohydrolase n=1 Tax=Izhakiella australiensis TaxID=1926881 RepID=A0A1S8YSS8_9GAMM|nr:amidohydrolase family protein [Izhakiella australiensis]OON42199.1 amidohydrolase [Izhakiella australiensis]